MKEYTHEQIRNIAFIGHGGSGKTSLSELMLFTAGEINRIGKIDEGNTVSDYNSNEIERKISISAALLHLEWGNTKINFIDTPGYSDFIGQVVGSLHVVDTVISVIKSAEGVEVGTEVSWSLVKKNNVPAAIIINKIDNEHSRFFETIQQAKSKLSNDITVVTFPVKEGLNVEVVVDLVKMKAYKYSAAGSKKVDEIEIPDEVKAQAEKLREELIEKVAESDEDLINKFFEEGTLSDEEIKNGLKKAVIKGAFIPAFAVSASRAIGINNFLDFASNYSPILPKANRLPRL